MVHNMAPMGLKVCVFQDIHERLSVFKCVTDRLLAYAQNASVLQSRRVCLCVCVRTCAESVSTTFNFSSPSGLKLMSRLIPISCVCVHVPLSNTIIAWTHTHRFYHENPAQVVCGDVWRATSGNWLFLLSRDGRVETGRRMEG